MPRTTILLADDHQIVRQGVRALLEEEPDLEVVGEAADGWETLALVERVRPDVLILDLMMPGVSGLEVIRQARLGFPATRIVVLSMHASEVYAAEALAKGALGYVLKKADASEIVAAVRAACGGRRYVSAPLSDLGNRPVQPGALDPSPDAYDRLTGREREVLRLAAEGLTSGEIAGRLAISPRTVEIHRSRLLHKLNLRGQTDLVRYALRHGIIALDD